MATAVKSGWLKGAFALLAIVIGVVGVVAGFWMLAPVVILALLLMMRWPSTSTYT